MLDRRGRELLAGFARPRNAALQRRLLKDQIGLLSGVRGLDEGSDHLVVFATAQIPGWTIAIDRPRPDVFAAARHGLVLALALLAAAAAAVFGLSGGSCCGRGGKPRIAAASRDSAASSRTRSAAHRWPPRWRADW